MPLFLLYLSNIGKIDLLIRRLGHSNRTFIPGDIMAKSFKWIYARICLCRICPGVAKRRAVRARRKHRALTRQQSSIEGVRRTIDFFFFESRCLMLICFRPQSSNDSYLGEDSETITSESVSVLSDEFSMSLCESSASEDDISKVTVPITTCLMMMIG